MGFTIEDMLTETGEKYKLKLVAGADGWSNSISWILLIEDMTILRNFKGKDLAVTTGLGFQEKARQLELVRKLISLGASGLIINTGMYIHEIGKELKDYCDENDFPLLTVPWDVLLFDMIKDLNIRVLLQGMTDDQISEAMIRAISHPEQAEESRRALLPYFDVDGVFQVFLIDTGDLDTMDTVERRRISFQLQIYLENISHNACFFYYDSCFVTVTNAVPQSHIKEVLRRFIRRSELRMQGKKVYVGVGSAIRDVSNLHLAWRRAKAAVRMAMQTKQDVVWFDRMGSERLLAMVEDPLLIDEMGRGALEPLIRHDEEHGTDYVRLLEVYLECGGSVRDVSEKMYTHRNTVIYRMGNIRKLLSCDLDSPDDRLRYRLACMLLHLGESGAAGHGTAGHAAPEQDMH